MSKEKEPKPRKLYDTCENCDEDYDLTPKNAGVMIYSKQKECSYCIAVCPHCNNQTRIFVSEEVLNEIIEYGLPMAMQEYADDNIYSDFLDAYEITLPKQHELTPRQEKLVNNTGLFLQHVVVTVDDFIGGKDLKS